MTSRGTRTTAVALLAAVGMTVTGCGSMSWDEKLDALRQAGERGADAHYVLLNQNKAPTKDECTANYANLDDGGAPTESDGVSNSKEWNDLHLSYFVDSCVSGKPRVPQSRPPSNAPAPTSTTIPASSVSPNPSAPPSTPAPSKTP
jgi:hypothetical protein